MELIDDLEQRIEGMEYSVDDWKILIDTLLHEKEDFVVDENRYVALSVALWWAIDKRKEQFLKELLK